MAMAKLKSEQDRMCRWLSQDPDYILDQCGDILSINEYRQVQKQGSALEKMKMLLKIILKDEATSQRFIDILRNHQENFPQLQEFLNPNTQGSYAPTVIADSSSIVSLRELRNLNSKSLTVTFETVAGAGSSQSSTFTGQLPKSGYAATNSSLILADKICNVSTEENINLSMIIKQSHQVGAGNIGPTDAVDETLSSSQGPAVKKIRDHKVKLIDALRADCSFILQHVYARNIVTHRQYHNLKDISQSEKTVTDLIDLVIEKGEDFCLLLLSLFKESEILSTYPKLKGITED